MTTAWIPTVADRYGAATAAQLHRAGLWRDDSLFHWLDHWADTQPAARAITDGVHDVDYANLRAQARRIAGWMAGIGVGAGDRIIVQLPNWSEFLAVYLGAARLGAVTVPVMMVYRYDEVEHIVHDSGATLAVTTGRFRGFDHAAMFRDLQRSTPALAHLMTVREAPEAGETAFEAVIDPPTTRWADEAELPALPGADDPHVIIYSSGTESKAKGCLHTWNTLAFTARALAQEVFEMTPDDTMFMPSPVAHSTGVVIGLVTPLLAGSSIHLQDVWEPTEALRRIEAFHCTIAATATVFVTTALQAAGSSGADLSSIRAWLCAGAPIPRSLAREFGTTFINARLLPLYGCTEVLAATVCRLDDDLDHIANSDGAPVSEAVEIKLIDEQGRTQPVGHTGEICYRGPGAILGYWADPERTERTIDSEGWHHCGDLGVVGDDGYLRVMGRVKDIIIRGGQNLSALEIEDHLVAHPSIRQAAAVAFPDERLGERVCAFLVLAPGFDAPDLVELREFLVSERQISIQKAPERLVVVDTLPTTATGKVQKYLLREQLRREAEARAVDEPAGR